MAAPRKYPEELRDRTVELLRISGRPVAHVVDQARVHEEALRAWLGQTEADRG